MATTKKGTHHKGPILVGNKDPFEGCPIDLVSHARSDFKVYSERFTTQFADGALSAAGVGATSTAIVTPTAATEVVTGANQYLLINPGTKADSGTGIQFNAPATAMNVANAMQSIGPITSTATLMDGKEIAYETRVGVMSDTTAWDGKTIFGWIVTDTALMTPGTGVASIGTGGGIGFHIGETGVVSYFTQATTVYNAVATSINVLALETAATLEWHTLGFRARWVDASAGTGSIRFFVDGDEIAEVVDDMPMQSTQVYSVSIEVLNGPARDSDVAIDYINTAITGTGR